jgi:methionyl-tRNA formyltransferase
VRIAFFGLPLAALLLERDGHDLALVSLSRLDSVGLRRAKKHFRGRILLQPKAGDPALIERVKAARADLLVSWFWTTLLPPALVAACPLGGIGVHPSLLPRHRGPDPYFWALDAGDTVTGVTAHRIAPAYDTGAILGQRSLPIDPSWDAWRLARALDRPSLALLREVVGAFARGEPPPDQAQDDAAATAAPAPSEEVCELRFTDPVDALLRRIRALSPAPAAFLEIGESIVSVQQAERATSFPAGLLPGEAAVVEGRAVVRAADGAIVLLGGDLDGEPAGVEELAALVASVAARS